ncbi:MAG TPA: hypothetical protein VEZ71_03005, partial [Archangium sp.]|nr:hypothetical protein [Archangium sp.]
LTKSAGPHTRSIPPVPEPKRRFPKVAVAASVGALLVCAGAAVVMLRQQPAVSPQVTEPPPVVRAQTRPAQSEPAQTGLAQSEPAQTGAAQTGSAQPEPSEQVEPQQVKPKTPPRRNPSLDIKMGR